MEHLTCEGAHRIWWGRYALAALIYHLTQNWFLLCIIHIELCMCVCDFIAWD
jgi:hypothetical protein